MRMRWRRGFNRNIVECKVYYGAITLVDPHSFNRNIVECKENNNAKIEALKQGFNRNIVECKEDQDPEDAEEMQVLIETLWNVK